ncbi:hypothetical protein [Mucilaginibacter antarcticus]|uniref:CBM6 domain-containing protein n=1 Tax=Mucilaginibacter antarcticus TaxID=1855725 RepID=A0ABW5XN06_9SPHI
MTNLKIYPFITLVLLSASCAVKKPDATHQQANGIQERSHLKSTLVWDSKSATGGEGWTGKGETNSSIKLDEPDADGKRIIHYHNKTKNYLYSFFGWKWAGPQSKSVNLSEYDAVSFDIKVTGPQKPKQMFFTVTELNPAPIPLSRYDSSFADGAWHRISIPVKDMVWRGSSSMTDRTSVTGFDFMTFVWDPADYDIQLDHFTFDKGTIMPNPWLSQYIPLLKPQLIPGRVECAYYNAGGEGVGYHDTDPVNILSGILNQGKDHQRPDASSYFWDFRKDEGVDISYTKDFADFAHSNLFNPPVNQLYIGGASNGEWVKYNVNVQKAGTYKIIALYGNGVGTLKFSVNNEPKAEGKFPVSTGSAHGWARGEIGTITFTETGDQVITMYYDTGNNLAYLEFIKN